jgi:hypothetical protein
MSATIKKDGTVLWRGEAVGAVEKKWLGSRGVDLRWVYRPYDGGSVITARRRHDIYKHVQSKHLARERAKVNPFNPKAA